LTRQVPWLRVGVEGVVIVNVDRSRSADLRRILSA
jgi:hypothetical protein